MKSNLLYRNEHQNCTFFHKDDATFDFKHSEKATEYTEQALTENLIILFLKGSCQINSEYYNNQIITEKKMIVLRKGDFYDIHTYTNTFLLFFRFQTPTSSCAKNILYSYNRPSEEYMGYILPIKKPIESYVQLLYYYISAGVKCEHLLDLKKDEFFLSLRWFYKKEDLAKFFSPILFCTCSFKKYILNNYDHVKNVSELIEKSNMSKSAFYTRFKQEFGISAKQWLTRQLKNRISKKILDPEVTPKDLMNEFNFSSPKHLNLFCKSQFGMTPSELIKKQRINNQNLTQEQIST